MPGTRKLGKTTDQRMAMLRQQVTDLLDNGKMETTVTRAKEIKPLAEKMITLGKKGDLAAYRQAMAFITREDVCKKTFKELAPAYAERNGGYTRIVRSPLGGAYAPGGALIPAGRAADHSFPSDALRRATEGVLRCKENGRFRPCGREA